MGRKIHMLVTGDHAGPAASGYPLLGADLLVDEDKRPFGWVDDMQFERGVRGPGQRSPITMWYIEGDGQKIVVDTGYDPSDSGPNSARTVLAKHGFALWTEHRPEWTVENQLAKVGVTPAEIDLVILTHCHFDHIGNNLKFPNARFLVQRDELPWALHPPAYVQFYYGEYGFNLLELGSRLEPIEGDYRVSDGITLKKLGGHTPGSQAVLVDTDAGRVCLSGDLYFFYRNLELNWPVGSFFDLRELMRGYAWMTSNADIVIPQHDWKFFEIYPDGFVG
jgi:glyoxylase-like metal-dependent hydrolase (beta-lactamase superfamily II)